jgi:hypothetical protein
MSAEATVINTEAISAMARRTVREIAGDEPLDRLAGLMLDYEIPPAFLWRPVYPLVVAAADAVVAALSADLARLVPGLAELDDALGRAQSLVDRDPTRALVKLAVNAAYFRIPDALLEPPAPDSRVLTALPVLRRCLDERGLVTIGPGLHAEVDIVTVGETAVPYHQLLRRRFQFHVNDALVAELLRAHRARFAVRVAIDERRLHPRREHRQFMEFDYWSGPPFSVVRLDDRSVRGVETRWQSWPVGTERILDDGEESVSIRTSLDGTIRTIEIEETTLPSLRNECSYQLVRYLHSQRDIALRTFIHVDGAVRFYDRDVYEARRTIPWPTDARGPLGRRKVWRVDIAAAGTGIPTELWLSLVTQWFRGNRLAVEALAEMDQEPAAK